MNDVPIYQLDRIFDAPRDMVWRAWSDPELVANWYGPGIETIIHEFDLRPGGVWRNEMKWGGKSDLSKMEFQEVVPMERIVWLHSSVDTAWNTVANTRMPDWPRVLLTTVTFTDHGEATLVRLTQVPVDASAAEITCFANMMGGMGKGWGGGYAIIDGLLEVLKQAAAG